MLYTQRLKMLVRLPDCSTALVIQVCLVAISIAMTACGGGPSSNTPPASQSVTVTVSPSSSSVLLGSTQQFTATVTGSSNTGVTWSVNGVAGGNATVGTISAAGLYTAPASVPTPNSVTVAATSAADSTKAASATVTVTASPPVTVKVSPTFTTVQTASIQQFTATVTGNSNTGVTWSVNSVAGGNSTVGTISATGLYTAPAIVPNPTSVTVTATSAADTTKSASAIAAITAPPPPVTVAVSPTSATVQIGAAQQFMATVTGASNTNVVWSVNAIVGGNSTVGTISASGLYTAPAIVPTPNSVTVSATSVADTTKSASAAVIVATMPQPVTVSMSPTSASVHTGATQQFMATVAGASDTSVVWSVNGAAGGNATVGTISTSGLYTAPPSVPSPASASVAATSVADSTKSALATVTITATIESVTATISAANGGTITLPSGSSVTIPAGALTSDQSVTLALETGMPQQPPSGLVVGVGPALVLSTAAPQFTMSTGTIQFAINYGTGAINTLQGSAAIADLIVTTEDNFFGVAGSFDSTANKSTISVTATLMNGTTSVVASMGNLAPPFGVATASASARATSQAATAAPSGELSWNGSAWVPYAGCPAGNGKHVLLLVHGMASSVEGAFPCVNQIMVAGHWDAVVGLDYNFLDNISGATVVPFVGFLNKLAMCGATLDIEAHSEGGPVAAYGITQASPQALASLRYLIGVGAAYNGTPVASFARDALGVIPFVTAMLSASFSEKGKAVIGAVPILGTTIADWQASQLLLQMAPNSAFLQSIQGTALHDKAPNLVVQTACGNPTGFLDGSLVQRWLHTIHVDPSDFLIGVNSCQAGGPSASLLTNTNVQYLPFYSHVHAGLACDSKLYADVGTFVQMQDACIPTDRTAHNNTCYAQYQNSLVYCGGLPTQIQQGDCVNTAIHTLQACLSYCTPP